MANASPRRPSLTIATAGHVDHGKTLLTRNLTGVDTDTLAEEKSRGLSINLGFAYSRYRADELECLLGFVDVPGHIDFIGNMLAGVGAVDAALLVVAADDGVMPQTREHAAILDLLEIRSGCVALTKIDRASKTRQHKVRAEVRELLASHGFGEPPVFLIDNGSGAGIEKLRNFLHRLLLAKHRRSANAASDRCRFLIDRAFSVRGIGTVVTGSCLAGRVTTGASLIHDRLGIASRVRGIRTHEHDQQELVAGERAALNIALETDQISRGDWLLDPALHHLTSRFDAKLRLLPGIAEPQPNVRHHLHVGASHRLASLRRLGASEYFQIRTSFPVHALHGDHDGARDQRKRDDGCGERGCDPCEQDVPTERVVEKPPQWTESPKQQQQHVADDYGRNSKWNGREDVEYEAASDALLDDEPGKREREGQVQERGYDGDLQSDCQCGERRDVARGAFGSESGIGRHEESELSESLGGVRGCEELEEVGGCGNVVRVAWGYSEILDRRVQIGRDCVGDG